jgi:ribosomal protein S18 acetylase RimI-like enzyme
MRIKMRQKFITDIGFITYSIEGSIVHLKTVWVNRLQRGQGHGTKMLQAFLDTLNDCVVLGECWYDKPLNFYKRLGFEVNETNLEDIWELEKEIE